MHTDALVSVIIPCKDGAAFLEEAVRSALAQTYPKLEIVVVDDGSTDGSADLAQRFPVRYIRQQNRGISEARNTGIWESRGSYVVFLDADDRLRPEAIETGLRILSQHPQCVMAVGDHVFVSADGYFQANSRKQCLLAHQYEGLLKSNFVEMISSVLFRRRVLEDVAGFNPTLRAAEDYELYLRIAKAYPICCHPVVVAEYRMHDGSMSRNPELMLTSTLQVLRGQARYVRNISHVIAFQEGLRFWRKYYGRQLASELAKSLPTMRRVDLVRKLFLLVREYPQGLAMLMLLRMTAFSGRGESYHFLPRDRSCVWRNDAFAERHGPYRGNAP
jgi:glycosyltransferase involved in cell wall biosynthesis